MANTFIIEPLVGGDDGVWGNKELGQNRVSLGFSSCYLYDDGGTLKISKGQIGFDDGTNKGIAKIDTITSISLAGVSNGNWAKIEMEITAGLPVFTASDILGATSSTALPAIFTGAWDFDKQNFYISATKKCVGLAWKTTPGAALGGVINIMPFPNSYLGYSPTTLFISLFGRDLKTWDALTAYLSAGLALNDSTGAQKALITSTGFWATVITAMTTAGLSIKELAGALGVFIQNSTGFVGIKNNAPSFALDITGAVKASYGRIISGSLVSDSSQTQNNVFDALSPFIPNTGDEIILSGGYLNAPLTNGIIAGSAKRTASNVVTIYGFNWTGSIINSLACTDGSATVAMTRVSISW